MNSSTYPDLRPYGVSNYSPLRKSPIRERHERGLPTRFTPSVLVGDQQQLQQQQQPSTPSPAKQKNVAFSFTSTSMPKSTPVTFSASSAHQATPFPRKSDHLRSNYSHSPLKATSSPIKFTPMSSLRRPLGPRSSSIDETDHNRNNSNSGNFHHTMFTSMDTDVDEGEIINQPPLPGVKRRKTVSFQHNATTDLIETVDELQQLVKQMQADHAARIANLEAQVERQQQTIDLLTARRSF